MAVIRGVEICDEFVKERNPAVFDFDSDKRFPIMIYKDGKEIYRCDVFPNQLFSIMMNQIL